MGLPINTPIAENAYSAPLRAPSLLICPSFATMAGMMESVQPDAKPYMMAYMMIGAFEAAGSQRARVMIPPKRESAIITLKTPKVSPMWAGRMRPNVLVLVSVVMLRLRLGREYERCSV